MASSRGIFDVDGLVTSEAVQIDLPAASLPTRMASGLIDLVITVLYLLLVIYLEPWRIVQGDTALLQALFILITVSALAALPIAQETLLRGRTVGKLALGLRTVRDDAGPITFRHALIRGLAAVVEVWLTVGALAAVIAASNTKAKRMGDLLAGTYVIKERSRMRLQPPPAMPPWLQGWAASADIGTLPDSLVVAARQLLARGESLTPQSRMQTGSAIHAEILRHVSPAPPPGSPPEAVIAAVLATRRERDLARLAREDALRARVLGPDPLG